MARGNYRRGRGTFFADGFNRDFAGRMLKTMPAANASTDYGLARQMAPGSNSLVSWVWNFENEDQAEIMSLFQRGKYAEAKQRMDEVSERIDQNIGQLLALRNARGKSELGDELASRAEMLAMGPFNGMKVRVGDAEMSLAQAMGRDGDVISKAMGDEFETMGIGRDVADMMFNGTDAQRAVFRGLVNPLTSGNRQVANREQRVDLVNELGERWDDYESAFGDGLPYLIQRLQSAHPDSGGTVEVLRSMARMAPSLSQSKGVEGKELARSMMSGYDALVNRVFARNTTSVDASGRPVQVNLSPSKRMAFDAALCSALDASAERGIPVDMQNPVFCRALSEASDLVSYASSMGVDLMSLGHDAGNPMSKSIGEYVADSVSGVTPTGANMVSSLRSLRNTLDNIVVGGNDFSTATFRMTGNPSDYLHSMNSMNGGFSTSPGADSIALGVKSYLLNKLVPGMMSGKDADTALRDAMSGALHSSADFLVGLSDVIAPYLSGPGKTEAADLLASKMMETLSSGRRTSVEDTVFDLAFGSGGNDSGPERVVLRNWYSGNVAQATRDAQRMTRLRSHYVNDENMPDYKAASLVGQAAQEAARVERAGGDWNQVYDSRIKIGTVYAPSPNPSKPGEYLMDPVTKAPVIDRFIADRTAYGYSIDGDNTAYESQQTQNRNMYEYRKAYAKAAATAAGRQSVEEDS